MKPVPFSGLKLDIVKGGETDDYPKPGNIVTVHYVAYLMMDDDGLPHDETKEKMPGPVFDSTYARDKPFKFKLGAEQVIEGLDKAVQQLSIGERAKTCARAACTRSSARSWRTAGRGSRSWCRRAARSCTISNLSTSKGSAWSTTSQRGNALRHFACDQIFS